MGNATVKRLGTDFRVLLFSGRMVMAWKPHRTLTSAMLQVQELEKSYPPEDIEVVEVKKRPPRLERKHG